jgi:hypothetical protein
MTPVKPHSSMVIPVILHPNCIISPCDIIPTYPYLITLPHSYNS